jgi:hypothetical protein
MGVGNPDHNDGGPDMLLILLVLGLLLLAGSCKVLDHYRPGWDSGRPRCPACATGLIHATPTNHRD